jgi:hypothetical protein
MSPPSASTSADCKVKTGEGDRAASPAGKGVSPLRTDPLLGNGAAPKRGCGRVLPAAARVRAGGTVRGFRGPIEHRAVDREPGTVAGAVPALFSAVPLHQATEMRTRRALSNSPAGSRYTARVDRPSRRIAPHRGQCRRALALRRPSQSLTMWPTSSRSPVRARGPYRLAPGHRGFPGLTRPATRSLISIPPMVPWSCHRRSHR